MQENVYQNVAAAARIIYGGPVMKILMLESMNRIKLWMKYKMIKST